uniref:DNA polymerase IV n=1 Tax=Candidatus Fimivicinus sp. TaxID=3056640 RepID=UPI003FEE43AA
MERVILHCDLNNFFASVELLSRPEWRHVPMAVCGSVEARHGVILAKNEPAKRYGVKTAETLWEARRKCPQLITVPPHPDQYRILSRRAHRVYERFTDRIEPFGIDECWLDVTGSVPLFGSGEEIAHAIRRAVKEELGLTVSVGVSFNKVFAKLGSDLKKPDAVTVIRRAEFQKLLWPLPVEALIGVGKSTLRILHGMGVVTIGDLAQAPLSTLRAALGKNGEQLGKNARGEDFSPVLSTQEQPPAKSIGRSTTCPQDLIKPEQVRRVILTLADVVAKELRAHGALAGGIQIGVRDSQLRTREFQRRFLQPTRLTRQLLDAGMELFEEYWSWRLPVRALGLRVSPLIEEGENIQLALGCDPQKTAQEETLEALMTKLQEKYGRRTLMRAAFLEPPK